MKLIFTILFAVTLSASSIKVAVAANLGFAIKELVKEFEKTHPDVKVDVIMGSSGKLAAQIQKGAPYGAFFSANLDYPKKLFEKGMTLGKPQVYVQGALVLFSRKKRDFSKGLELLLDRSIKKVAIGNPKTAPYGQAAKEALEKSALHDKIKAKLIYGESISQTLTYALHIVDAAFVAKSSLFSPKMAQYKQNVNWIDVDTALYTPIEQGAVLLKADKDSKAFYEFMFSQKAKAVLRRFGYIVS